MIKTVKAGLLLVLTACAISTFAQRNMSFPIPEAPDQASSATPDSAATGQSLSTPQKRGFRYTVHPSDVLEVTFPLTPEFDQTVTVKPDGSVSLRGVGELSVAGETVQEVTDTLRNAYKPVLKDPMIYVNPKDFEKPYFVVGGQVAHPGKFDWRGDVTAAEAIEFAGGFLDSAKHSQVLLFRRVSVQWAHATLIDEKAMLSSHKLSEDPILEPGDMLYVPKNRLSKVKPFIPLPSLGLYSSQF